MIKAELAVTAVKDAYSVLMKENDLSPNNPCVNDTLGRLVRTLSDDYSHDEILHVLRNPCIKSMRSRMLEKLSLAEGQMELYWSCKMGRKPEITQSDLESFWYWKNYHDLVAEEARYFPLEMYAPNESICLVGAGPLPLTAIVLLQEIGKKVTCVDIDAAACHAAERFIFKAGLKESINVVCTDGAQYNYRLHPHVLLASLVPNKGEVIRRIYETSDNPSIAIRSAERLHTLLYDPVDETDPELAKCSLSFRTAYKPDIINTTLFYQAVQGPDWNKDKTITGQTFRNKYGWRNPERSPFPKNVERPVFAVKLN